MKNILVVDDSEEIAQTKVWVIQKLGARSFKAESVPGGHECLLRLKKPPKVDLILLDMDMPEINGADVIRALLKMESPPVKILPMTAWGPGWIRHWNLSDLAETAAFKRWVWPVTYDKASDAEDMMKLIHRILKEGSK